MNVVSCDLDDEDAFVAADESMALQGLIDEAMTGYDHCPLEEYVNGEDDVPVCMLVQILGKKNSLIIMARKIKVKIKMKKQYCHCKIFNFSLNLEGVYNMLCKWGILWTIYLLYSTDSHYKIDHSS